MSNLTIGNNAVKDGSGALITGGVETYTDPNRSNAQGAVVAVVLNDGTILSLGQALAAASLPVVLPAAQITSLTAPQLAAGTNVIGHVIADTGSTTAVTGNVAGTVADGASVTLGAKADAKSTATDTTAVTAMSVLKQISASVQAPPSQAVTNAGTFAVQAAVTTAGFTSQPTVTRPANTTPYTAGDVVGGAITFTAAGPSGGVVLITGLDLRLDIASLPTGMTSFRLHLYDATPPSATADNGAWDLPSGDRANYLGYVDLNTPTDLGSTLFVQADSVNKQVKLNASTSLFGYLVTTGGFTPAANSEVYTPRLQTVGV